VALLAAFITTAMLSPAVGGAQSDARYVTSIDGVRIAYEQHGDASPVLVFVHGWSCNRRYWAAQIPEFAKRFRVIALDLGGHGDSEHDGRHDWTIASFGNDVASVVQKLELRRVILIGHSMGGDVITEAARHLKGRIIGLIWLDTYKQLGLGRSPEAVDEFVTHLRGNFVESTRALVRSLFVPTSDRALIERVVAEMSSAPPEIALSAIRSSLSYSRQIAASLDELQLPVIAINPDNAPTDVESMKRHGVTVVIMPGVGHFAMMEDPPRLNALLRSAIDRLNR
jgi:pimeloyl-ACP methyl ester carboxylesterase